MGSARRERYRLRRGSHIDGVQVESDAALCENLNVIGPENLSSVAKKIGATLIHISTDYVFDGNGYDGNWVKEAEKLANYAEKAKNI